MKSMKRSLVSRLDKHFAGASALAAAAGVAGTVQQADAGIVYSGVVNLPTSTTTNGLYINIVNGQINEPGNTSGGSVPGWDLNIYGAGQYWWSNQPGGNWGCIASAGVLSQLPPGTMIDGSSINEVNTALGTGMPTGLPGAIFGFRFTNEAAGGQVQYGWGRYYQPAAGGPGVLVDYAYEDTGLGIAAGDIGGAVTGGCCLTNGSCVATTSANCTNLGGVYRGDNSTCATANCPAAGACCLALGACSSVTAAACTTAGGIYHGDGTSCATAACPGGLTMNCNLPGTFTDISATGTPIVSGDDNTGPFTSSVTNALVTNANLYACTNGFISNSATFAAYVNATLPVSVAGLTLGLFPNWNDLYVDGTTGFLLHQGLVENGVNVEVIEWYNVTDCCGGGPTGNFEVKIFGAGGPALVQYLYQGMGWDTNGANSTVGVQWTANLAYQSSYNTPGSIADGAVCSILLNAAPAACYANCDNSTNQPCLNVLDFSCFLNKFAAQDTYANCDNSTNPPVLNVLDFSCFLNKFAAGCSSC